MYNKVTFLVTNTAVVGIQLLLVALSRNKCCFFQFCWLPVVFSNTTQGFHLSLSVLLPSKMGSLSCSFLLAGDLKILCRSLLGWYLFWLEVVFGLWFVLELHPAFKTSLSLPVVGSFSSDTSPHLSFRLWIWVKKPKSWPRCHQTSLCNTAGPWYSNLLFLTCKTSFGLKAGKGRLPFPWLILSLDLCISLGRS